MDHEVFVRELRELRAASLSDWSRDDQADYWSLTAGLNQVYWELSMLRPHWRDPGFYVQQSYGAVWDVLVRKPEVWSEARVKSQLLPRLKAASAVLMDGVANFKEATGRGEPVQTFATLALQNMGWNGTECAIGVQLRAAVEKLLESSSLNATTANAAAEAASQADSALNTFATYIHASQPHWSSNASIGEGWPPDI